MNERDQELGVIKISATEANSAHVDDLLRRQANLRGETGIARDRRASWYLQSWFVLGIAGAMAALSAWLVITPYFNDSFYIHGRITAVSGGHAAAAADAAEPGTGDGPLVYAQTVSIGAQQVLVASFTKEVYTGKALRSSQIAVGSDIGIYAVPNREEDEAAEGGEGAQGTEGGKGANGAKVAKGGRESKGAGVRWIARFVDFSPDSSAPSTLTLEELARRSNATALVVFAVMAALIGLFIGAIDGVICRAYARAALSGLIGMGVGFLGGFILSIFGNLIYSPLNHIANAHMQPHEGTHAIFTVFGFFIQIMGRTLAWGLVGVSMGLGQGIALRSKRLLLFGILGGVVGGLLGGLLFDPIDLLFSGANKPSAALSRLIGFMVIGASVGATIGMVELMARDAWLRMEQGPLAGKEFLVFKDVMKVGASPSSDIYLFNDPQIQGHHATLRMVGENLEIESAQVHKRVLLNDRPITKARLRHGDRIAMGRTTFIYQKKGG